MTAAAAEMAAHPIKMSRFAFAAARSAGSDLGLMARRLVHLSYGALAARHCREQRIPPPPRPFRTGAGNDRLVRVRDTELLPRRLHLHMELYDPRLSGLRRSGAGAARSQGRLSELRDLRQRLHQVAALPRHRSALLGPLPCHPLRHRHSRLPTAATPANAGPTPNR